MELLQARFISYMKCFVQLNWNHFVMLKNTIDGLVFIHLQSNISNASASANHRANFLQFNIVGMHVLCYVCVFSIWCQYNWGVWNVFLLVFHHAQRSDVFPSVFQTTEHFEVNEELDFVQQSNKFENLHYFHLND